MKLTDTKMRLPEKSNRRKKDFSVTGANFSIYSSADREELFYVDIHKIKVFEGQAREYFDEKSIKSLAKSIEEHGIRSPLTLHRKENQDLEVISGERRLKAAKIAGLKKVPAFILDDKEKAESIAVIENVQREDLHPIEFGQACRRLLEMKICKNAGEISENIGVSRTVVVESIGYLDIPEEIKQYLLKNKKSSRAILRTLKGKSIDECREILGLKDSITKTNISSRSLMRIDIKNDQIYISKLKKELLTPALRKNLIESLEGILKEI